MAHRALARYFVNSLIVCTCAAALSVFIATFAAYAVSRYRFRGRRVFAVVVLSTQMFHGILFLLPLFLIFISIGNATGITLYGSRAGLIVTYLTWLPRPSGPGFPAREWAWSIC